MKLFVCSLSCNMLSCDHMDICVYPICLVDVIWQVIMEDEWSSKVCVDV